MMVKGKSMGGLTRDRLLEVLDYDPGSGLFVWKKKTGRSPKGSVAGSLAVHGYIEVGLDGRLHRAHRLAWLYMSGDLPNGQIDHINGDRSDNRFANLRDVTSSDNSRNTKISSRNSSGVIGVSWEKALGKWRSQISADGKRKYLGVFDSLEDAAAARKEAEIKYGYHENHGRAK